jgi:hypothetical protein
MIAVVASANNPRPVVFNRDFPPLLIGEIVFSLVLSLTLSTLSLIGDLEVVNTYEVIPPMMEVEIAKVIGSITSVDIDKEDEVVEVTTAASDGDCLVALLSLIVATGSFDEVAAAI